MHDTAVAAVCCCIVPTLWYFWSFPYRPSSLNHIVPTSSHPCCVFPCIVPTASCHLHQSPLMHLVYVIDPTRYSSIALLRRRCCCAAAAVDGAHLNDTVSMHSKVNIKRVPDSIHLQHANRDDFLVTLAAPLLTGPPRSASRSCRQPHSRNDCTAAATSETQKLRFIAGGRRSKPYVCERQMTLLRAPGCAEFTKKSHRTIKY